MADNRFHYVSRPAMRITPIATACGVRAVGKSFTSLPDKVTCALCRSSNMFLDIADDNEQASVELPVWSVVQDPDTKDYVVLGDDPPVRELARVGHWVYLRGAAALEREAYEKLRLAAVYRLGVEAMIENGE